MSLNRGGAASAFESGTISDFHIYTLSRRATVNENQQKQI